MRLRFCIVVCALAPLGAVAQEKPQSPQVPMVIEPADADAFRDIIDGTIPPRYSAALIRWYNAIVQRQLAKQTELLKQQQETK